MTETESIRDRALWKRRRLIIFCLRSVGDITSSTVQTKDTLQGPAMSRMLTVVLLGNSAVGKSASGNTILARPAFDSRFSFKPVTTHISEATERVGVRQVSVVDTPGILNPNARESIRLHCEEILLSGQPCLFLVVLNVGRVSSEQEQALRAAMEVLGDKGMSRSILLFTFGEALKGRPLKDFIYEDDEGLLPDIFSMFGQRHHVFDNEAWGPEQVQELLQKSDRLQAGFASEPAVRPSLQHRPVRDAGQTPDPALVQVGLGGPRSLRLVLLGLPGAGKSSAGNTILGTDKFKTSCGFNAISTESVDKTATVLDREVTVVDTPGFSDTKIKPKKLFKRIMKSVIRLFDGPHAFIIVVRIGRVFSRDAKLLELIPKLFDEDASKFTMILFTHGDNLGTENITQLISDSKIMESLVKKCNQRYTVFNNKQQDTRNNKLQIQQLLDTIDAMVRASGQDHCTSQIYKTTAEEIRALLKERWEKIKDIFTKFFRPTTDSDEETQPMMMNEMT